ncbi:MAG TPA: hypothetical protein VHW00_12435 [Thermoanaerobaculia bacterium]|nr:hypothetical protein [Thermoanaerobaculia bacterium]
MPLTQQLEIEDVFAVAAARLGVYEDHLSIAGLHVQLRFAGDRLRTRLLPALTHRITVPRDPDATILIYDCASARIEKPAVPWRAEDVGVRGEVQLDDALRVSLFAPSGALSVFDASRNLGIFTVGDAIGLPSYERAAPFRTLLHWLLESRNCRLAHAAAVATDRGGALLAGRGGSGKSTTALLCATAGLRYAGDDYVGITAAPATAHALYSSAKIDATSAALLPGVALHIDPRENEKGVALLTEVADSFPIRALVLPRVTGGTSRLRRASGAEALRALAPTTVFQLPGNDGATFAWMATLARTIPAFALDLGDDREQIPALVQRAIEESA